MIRKDRINLCLAILAFDYASTDLEIYDMALLGLGDTFYSVRELKVKAIEILTEVMYENSMGLNGI